MTRAIRLTLAAGADLAAATDWLDGHHASLARHFIAALDGIFARLVEYPEMYPVVMGRARRSIVQPFGYMVLYRVQPATIEVIGILPCRENPSKMARRIESSTPSE